MPMRLTQAAFVGGEIAPQLYGRVDVEKYQWGLAEARNVCIARWGGAFNRPGTQMVGEVAASASVHCLKPFTQSIEQTYVTEWGAQTLRIIKDGAFVTEAAKTITSATNANPGVFTSAGHGLANGNRVRGAIFGMVGLNGEDFVVRNQTTNTFTLEDLYGNAVDTTSLGAFTSGSVARIYSIATPYSSAQAQVVGYAQTASEMYLAHRSFEVRKLTRASDVSWSFATVTFGPKVSAPTSPSAVATTGTGSTTYSYKITAYDDETGEESLPSSTATCTNDLTVSGNKNTISWTAVSGAERYLVYKEQAGVFGLIGGTTGTSIVDQNVAPDLADTPPGARNPFNASNKYPGVAEFHEGRLCLASTNENPAGVWFSQSTRYENFNVSVPAKADDSLSFALRPGVNAVRGVASLEDLLVLTSEAEFRVNGGGVTDYLTPASIVVRRQTTRGAKDLRPLIVGDIVLYVQRQGTKIVGFGYSFESDGYRGNDLTLLAPHLFEGRSVVDWCYQQDPHSLVWVVLDNGDLLSLTFVEEQNVFAWAKHTLGGGGAVEALCCIEGDSEDEVYLTVRRTINGQTKRYVEKMRARSADPDNVDEAWFLDCAVRYSGSATTTIYGLRHLEGLTVSALADGNVVEGLVVSGGKVTLPGAASLVTVGLPYSAWIKTLPIAPQTQEGAPQGRKKIINKVVAKVRNTRGIKVGPDAARLIEWKQRQLEPWSDPMGLFTGDVEITITSAPTKNGDFVMRQDYPLPMEVLALYPDVTVGG